MFAFIMEASFYGVSVDNLTRCGDEDKLQIQRALLDGLNQGYVKPFKRKLFYQHSTSEMEEFLKTKSMEEKTALCFKEKSPVRRKLQYNSKHLVVIAGTSSNLWVDVASWAISHGGKTLIVLTTEKMLAGNNFHRVNKLISRHKSTLILYPLSRLDAQKDGLELFKELLQIGSIDSIICVSMDENGNRMKNLDTASRQLVPGLRQFVSLLGYGAGVSESRANSGLPVCSVQRDTTLESPANVLLYLSSLLADNNPKSKFYVVGDPTATSRQSNKTVSLSDVKQHLPQSVEELEALGQTTSEVQLHETSSLSPRYDYVRHQLLPIFVFPGLVSSRLEPLTKRLMHPVFCPSLPPSLPSVEQSANYLLEQIQVVQEKGPYSLIAETWSGAEVLELTTMLEARGHQVTVFLLDAAPTTIKAWARVFRKPSGLFFSAEFLGCILNLEGSVVKRLNDLMSWEEQLEFALEHLPSSFRQSSISLDCVRKSLNDLKTRVTALLDYQPQNLLLKGNVHLIRTREASESDWCDTLKYCQQRPFLHIMEDETLAEVISDPKTAVIINDNAMFTWNL